MSKFSRRIHLTIDITFYNQNKKEYSPVPMREGNVADLLLFCGGVSTAESE